MAHAEDPLHMHAFLLQQEQGFLKACFWDQNMRNMQPLGEIGGTSWKPPTPGQVCRGWFLQRADGARLVCALCTRRGQNDLTLTVGLNGSEYAQCISMPSIYVVAVPHIVLMEIYLLVFSCTDVREEGLLHLPGVTKGWFLVQFGTPL